MKKNMRKMLMIDDPVKQIQLHIYAKNSKVVKIFIPPSMHEHIIVVHPATEKISDDAGADEIHLKDNEYYQSL